ncbi:MAG: NTP transferase domain-containing protein [Candidatus Aegiribacteria sp.]|nr:NTP transferase domain-containing protein [Candidatus Aegiribacteria sp.]
MIFSEISLLILAGGESSRMGCPKHLLPASGGTMIDYIINRLGSLFTEVMVAGRGIELNRSDARIVEDIRLKRSPLVGILSGMKESSTPDVFVIGCDMPFVKPGLIHCLTSRKDDTNAIVIPVIRGYFEPLCAIYSCSTSDRIAQYLDSGGRKVTGFFQTVSVREVKESEIRLFDPLLKSFINLNTPNDYRNYYLS